MTARVLHQVAWPADAVPPQVPGFIHSDFSPVIVAVADRCLDQHHQPEERTAVLIVSSSGDLASAAHVAHVVAEGKRVGPLFFFQSVPNSIAGHVAARWDLNGPVVCLSPVGDPMAAAVDEAELLFDDGACERALVVLVEQDGDAVVTASAALLVRADQELVLSTAGTGGMG